MPNASGVQTPSINLPMGGGAVSGIGESFHADPFTGTGTFAIPIPVSQGRGTTPAPTLQYSSGYGNGPFGLGWRLNTASIARRTDKGIPRYIDDTDIYLLSGYEELVPLGNLPVVRGSYQVSQYEPRVDGTGMRIELWRSRSAPRRDCFWRVISRRNETSIYGRTAAARIVNPDDADEIFDWALEETFDASGNHVFYEYVQDRAHAQRYLRRALYADTTEPHGPLRRGTHEHDPTQFRDRRYLLEVGFDYGDGGEAAAARELRAGDLEVPASWPVRADPFSSCRAGFEVRTTRRCARVVMHHHFAELQGQSLVKATALTYRAEPCSGLSLLDSVTVTGYRVDSNGSHESSLPPLTLRYSEFEPGQQRHRAITVAGDQYPLAPLSDPSMALVDLGSRGLPDILQTNAAGYRYWRNLGNGRFDRPRLMANSPAGLTLDRPGVRLADVSGAGHVALAAYDAPVAGAFETDGRQWKRLRRFTKRPAVSPADPDVVLTDLTGDGLSDLVESTPGSVRWYRALGIEGYDAPQSVRRTRDLDQYPDFRLTDPTGRVRIADMNGDGLADVVLLHDGRIEYWPSLGYGRFGPRVVMTEAPRFGRDFDPARLFFADVDGSGTSDLVHVGYDEVRVYSNQSGNRWSEPRVIRGTPRTSALTDVRVADLTGSGTATLVWSETLARRDRANYRYLDLCGGNKPYVLVEVRNNMGASTRVLYGTSTAHMLRDEGTADAWQTRLPFPVHVVDTVESLDFITGVKRVSNYAYHHGFYDGVEREFRGFGCVDRRDGDDRASFAAPGLHGATASNATPLVWAPPLLTRSWFHTGAYFEDRELTERYRAGFYSGDASPMAAGDHQLELGSRPRDVYRALRGRVVRTESYGLDGSSREGHPYALTEHRYLVRQRRPVSAGGTPVLFTAPLETMTVHYERQPTDPRVTQELTISVDDHGGVVERILVSFPRKPPVPFTEQARTSAMLEWNRLVNVGNRADECFAGIVCEERRFAITGLTFAWPSTPGPVRGFTAADFAAVTGCPDQFERAGARISSAPGLRKRLLEWQRFYFADPAAIATLAPPDSTQGRLPLGQIAAPAMPFETLKAAFEDRDLVAAIGADAAGLVGPDLGYRRDHSARATDPARHYWWISGGRQAFDPARHFMLSSAADLFGQATAFEYDRYDLLLTATVDPLRNRTSAGYDYRVLQPIEVTAPSGDRQQIVFDAFGFPAAFAQMGRVTDAAGDSLAGIEPDLSAARVREYFDGADAAVANTLRREATTRFLYDLHRFADLGEPPAVARIGQLEARSFAYFDGSGKEVQSRLVGSARPSIPGAAALQWLATGFHVVNNKGDAVRRGQPFYTPSHRFAIPPAQQVGDTALYDPLGRAVGMLYADHTWDKTIIGCWQQEVWERGDTVLVADPSADADIGPFFANLPASDYLPTWHAARAASPSAELQAIAAGAGVMAATPITIHFDQDGRPFRREDKNGGRIDALRCELDHAGRVRALEDARRIIVCRQSFDLLGRPLMTDSVDAGTRRTLPDAGGQVARAWDGTGHQIKSEVDALRRPTSTFTRRGRGGWREIARIEYGESAPASFDGRLRRRTWRIFDSAGVVEHLAYDHRGNVRASQRTFADWNGSPIDWQRSPALLGESILTSHARDGLDRISSTSVSVGAAAPWVINRRYGRDTLLDAVDVISPDGVVTPIVTGIAVNARGQRAAIAYGNGVSVEQTFDPATSIVTSATARRADGTQVQALRYEYDATGNLALYDDASLNARLGCAVASQSVYGYDSRSRLIRATGRERAAAGPCSYAPAAGNLGPAPFAPGQPVDLTEFEERYSYDAAGNLQRIDHTPGSGTAWSRIQTYDSGSNRLLTSKAGCAGESSFRFRYDDNGNPLALPGGAQLEWDSADRLQRITLASGASVLQAYDIQGGRVRKRTNRADGSRFETMVAGPLEIHEERSGVTAVRHETLHVEVHGMRVALIERSNVRSSSPATRVRYLLSNHLHSSTVELNASGQVVSSEEYLPYGGAAYVADRIAATPQRFRFSGRELDDETGLYSWGARFYAPWLCRWLSPDPRDLAQLAGALDDPGRANLYLAFNDNPLVVADPTGLAELPPGATASTVSYDGLTIFYKVENYGEFVKIRTFVQGAKEAGGLVTNYNPTTGTLTMAEAYNPFRGTGQASGLMRRLLAEQLQVHGVKAGSLRMIRLDTIIHQPTIDAVTNGARFAETEAHALMLRRAAELGIRVELQEAAGIVTMENGARVIPYAAYRIVPSLGSRFLSLLGMGTSVVLGPGLAVAPIFWTALTDDPKRAGQFHRDPMFTPYANAEMKEMKDNLARMEGFEDYDHFSSVLAFKVGCDDCVTLGGQKLSADFRELSMKQLADMPFDYDADRAREYLDALAMQSPAYPTIGPAPAR